MNKRQFLTSAILGGAVLPAFAVSSKKSAGAAVGPTILTVIGAIGRGNRGRFDAGLDQMMHKQNIHFDNAFTFDFSAISALPSLTIKPTLPYDSKSHVVQGPLLTDVIKATGAAITPATKLFLRAIDGYAVLISMDDAQKYRFIVATHLDNRPLPLGGLGPLWAVYNPDDFPEMAAKKLDERFALCPWGLYCIEVKTA